MEGTSQRRISAYAAVLSVLALLATACTSITDRVSAELEEIEESLNELEEEPAEDPTDDEVVSDIDPEPLPEPPAENELLNDVPAEEDLDEIIDDAEEAAEPEVLLEAPEVTFRPIDGASESSIEHVAYVEAFWTEVAPELGFDYELINTKRLFPRSTLNESDTCSFRRIQEPIDGDIAAFNAYVSPCDEGVTMVWDDIGLEADLEERYPGAGMAMLISHEWGHIIQFQRNQWTTLPDIIAEQQADCYSGAYAAWAEDRGIEPFTNAEALDFAVLSTLETRDAVGSRPDEFGAHGNGFDRVRATQEGYDRGVTFCDSYEDTPPPITQTGFTSAADRENEGNLPFEPAFELLVPAVVDYFESLSSEPLQPFVDEPSERVLRELHSEIGDLAIGTEYALRYGAALQEANGDEVDGVGPALQRACLTGSFLEEALNRGIGDDGTGTGQAAGTLSPGDLDEAIITFSSSDELLANPGVVFEMIAALRVGTLEGIDACALA